MISPKEDLAMNFPKKHITPELHLLYLKFENEKLTDKTVEFDSFRVHMQFGSALHFELKTN
jgi:hypothetical protein